MVADQQRARGLYIYWYDVDGVPVADPKNNRPRVNMGTIRSLLEVPGIGSGFFAARDVPHGTVSTVWYQSSALGVQRRMQIYTPPGYAISGARYPVFYLLHGAGDDDQAWLMAGRANFILDNLIAAGKAKPMIVVMPAGHTPRPSGLFGPPGSRDPFLGDFARDITPYVDKNFRVLPGARTARSPGSRWAATTRSRSRSRTPTSSATSACSARASSARAGPTPSPRRTGRP